MTSFDKKSYMFSKFCSNTERFRSENRFFSGFDIKKSHCPFEIFFCLTLQKCVFPSLPFHIWIQFGEQIGVTQKKNPPALCCRNKSYPKLLVVVCTAVRTYGPLLSGNVIPPAITVWWWEFKMGEFGILARTGWLG